MSRPYNKLRHLRRDSNGATVVEFALLAPVFLMALLGLLETGLYMQNYNAVRSVSSDAARLAAVEYQRFNELDKDKLKAAIEVIAVQSPYNLNQDRLVVTVEPQASTISGAKAFDLDVTYTPPGFLDNLGMENFQIAYSRPLYVIDNAYDPDAEGG